MGEAATTTLSTKGQVVIPEEIRSRLGLKPGTQFVVIADRDAVIFKVLEPPSLEEFKELLRRAKRVARETGLTREEVKKEIEKVQRSK
jgi:AbrB family looped-hinge helix DNA binding protein